MSGVAEKGRTGADGAARTGGSSASTYRRPNPALDKHGAPRPKLGWLALYFEGASRPLLKAAALALAVFFAATTAWGLVVAAMENASGLLFLMWGVFAFWAFIAWRSGPSRPFVAYTLACIGLSVLAVTTDPGDARSLNEFGAAFARAELWVALAAIVALNRVRAGENKAGSAKAKRVWWAVELALLATTCAFLVWLLWPALGVPALACLIGLPPLARQVVALRRGDVRVPAVVLDSSPGPDASSMPDAAVRPGSAARHRAHASSTPVKPELDPHPAQAPPEDVDELLAELDRYAGLKEVKRQVRELADHLAVQAERRKLGLKADSGTLHLRFEGPPGVGKTDVARLLARIYRALGLLESGHLVEANRAKLVGAYQGHTAQQVDGVCQEALDGVLFVDEAYALAGGAGDTFGQEAVAQLIQWMENERDRLVVILAGYPDAMARLMDSNAGLRSRVGAVICFEEYDVDELVNIAEKFAADGDYEWSADARSVLGTGLRRLYDERDETWGNAREVRKLYSLATRAHSKRVRGQSVSRRELRALTAPDAAAALTKYGAQRDADRAGRQKLRRADDGTAQWQGL